MGHKAECGGEYSEAVLHATLEADGGGFLCQQLSLPLSLVAEYHPERRLLLRFYAHGSTNLIPIRTKSYAELHRPWTIWV
jgi:hypothetical protein